MERLYATSVSVSAGDCSNPGSVCSLETALSVAQTRMGMPVTIFLAPGTYVLSEQLIFNHSFGVSELWLEAIEGSATLDASATGGATEEAVRAVPVDEGHYRESATRTQTARCTRQNRRAPHKLRHTNTGTG